MKKQIAAISILILFLMLSSGAVNVSAGGGTCSIPSCRPKAQDALAPKPGVTLAPAQDPSGNQTLSPAQAQDSFGLVLLAVRWAMSFPYFL